MNQQDQNKLFKEQKETTYKIQKDLGLTHDRLYKYAKCKRKVENMPVDLLMELAHYHKIEMNKMYNLMLEFQKEKLNNKNH